MIYYTNEQWKKRGITADMEKLLATRLLELFDDKTFDSWQVRYSSPVSIMVEIVDALSSLVDAPVTHHNIKQLLDEAGELFKSDPVIQSCFPMAPYFLSQVSYEKLKQAKPVDVEHASHQVNVLLALLSQYRDVLIKELFSVLASGVSKEKERFLQLIDRLATHLVTCGYSTQFLRDAFKGEVDKVTESPLSDRFFAMLGNLPTHAQDHQCYCLVRWPPSLLRIVPDEIIVVDKSAREASSEHLQRLRTTDRDATVVRISIKAMDPFAARHMAALKLGQIHAMYRLYAPSRPANVREHESILVHSADGTWGLLHNDESRLQYVRDAKRPEDGVSKLCALRQRSFPALMNSLQYHRLHADAGTDEARLVNLWVALETVVPRQEASVIGSICEYVPYSLASSYVQNVCRALASSCQYLWIQRESDCPFAAHMPRSKGKYMDLNDLLQVMTDEDNGIRISAFMQFASEHPLLLNRINDLWEKMFKDPQTLASRLEVHLQHVEWQVRRIYRSRNSILHRGGVVPGIRHLIQHLHTYYVGFMHNLIKDLEENQFTKVEEALMYRKGQYLKLLSDMKQPKNGVRFSADTIRLLDLNKKSPTEEILWEHLS